MPILNWLNKDQAVTTAKNCDYRLLEEVPSLSYGDLNSENLLIQGDNLEALKALIPFYAGKVKCIFIDPPYNTKSAFAHYDDNLEHSKWLSLIYPRLELLRELLSEDGSIWATLDDNEAHYFRVIMDEIFGRKNFVANCVWQSKDTPGNNANEIAQTHNHIIVFKKGDFFKPKLLARSEKQLATYKNLDKDPRGVWLSTPLTRVEHRERDYYPIKNKNGRDVLPPKGSSWRRPPDEMKRLESENRIYWGKDGNAEFPMEKKFLTEVKAGVVPQTWWPYELAGSTRNASAEMKGIFDGAKSFDTPKPEKLISKVIDISTNEGDLVLDSFLGSGTTSAVAHKMKRRYIGIEIGEHAQTHCQPRLQKVVDGDEGGISKSVDWKGGGGFKFVKLGKTVFDEYGCLNKDIKFATLASHVWYLETKQTMAKKKRSAYLGVHGEAAYYLLYNGILGDRRPDGGNVLTSKVIKELAAFDEHKKHNRIIVIYGESTRLGEARLRQENIVFKQIPYDVGAL